MNDGANAIDSNTETNTTTASPATPTREADASPWTHPDDVPPMASAFDARPDDPKPDARAAIDTPTVEQLEQVNDVDAFVHTWRATRRLLLLRDDLVPFLETLDRSDAGDALIAADVEELISIADRRAATMFERVV